MRQAHLDRLRHSAVNPPVRQEKRATLARVRRKELDVALLMDGLSVLISARVGFSCRGLLQMRQVKISFLSSSSKSEMACITCPIFESYLRSHFFDLRLALLILQTSPPPCTFLSLGVQIAGELKVDSFSLVKHS